MKRSPLRYKTLAGFANQNVKFVSFNPRTDEQRVQHWKSFERVRSGFYGRMTTRIRDALLDQRGIVMENVNGVRRPGDIPLAVRAGLKKIRPPYEQAIRELYVQVVSTFADLTEESFPKAYSFVGHSKADTVWDDAANGYVTQEGGTLIVEPNATMKRIMEEATRAAVRQGLEEGWGIPRIAEQIRVLSNNAVSEHRAVVIARTETIRASNFGAMEAGRRSGLSLNKEWIATADDRVRETHDAAHSQVVRMNEKFVVGGYPCRFPADAMLPAHESIQCRCTVAFIPIT